jgi:hypothetical protein
MCAIYLISRVLFLPLESMFPLESMILCSNELSSLVVDILSLFVLCGTVQYSTVRYGTVRYVTAVLRL